MFGISFCRFKYIGIGGNSYEQDEAKAVVSNLCSIKSNLWVVLYFMVFFYFNLNAQNYENKYLKDRFHTVKGLGLHTDLGYSSYQIEVDSSEMALAIDYDVLEYTLGLSYVYGSWMMGIYGKFLVDEVESNMFVTSTHQPLNNHATINKRESAFYINYTLSQQEQRSWRLNLLYRHSSLEAEDSFVSFYNYRSYFNYDTEGVALSLVYSHQIGEGFYFLNTGVLYTQAEVKISDTIEERLQDVFVDDRNSAVGFKVAMGYSYNLTENLIFNLRADAWWLRFHSLKVASLVGDQLPKAELKEESFTTYTGFSWRF